MTGQKNPPPTSNTGVEKPSVSLSLDWIEGTFPEKTPVLLPENFSEDWHECKPRHGYTIGNAFSDGRVSLTAPLRPDMGTHIIWSGSSLAVCPMLPSGLVHFLSRAGFRFTRLDMAIDVRNWKLKPRHATLKILQKEIITRAKQCPRTDDPMFGGYTQYVGKKSSSLFLRIYDKAAQMGVNADWTRVELVASGRRANAASIAVIRGEDYRSLVMGFVRFPTWAKWNAVMASKPVTIPTEKTRSNTEKWLLKQAAPALALILADAPDNAFLNEFLAVVIARKDDIILKRTKHEQMFDTDENSD
jgi:hypothetical protein